MGALVRFLDETQVFEASEKVGLQVVPPALSVIVLSDLFLLFLFVCFVNFVLSCILILGFEEQYNCFAPFLVFHTRS